MINNIKFSAISNESTATKWNALLSGTQALQNCNSFHIKVIYTKNKFANIPILCPCYVHKKCQEFTNLTSASQMYYE